MDILEQASGDKNLMLTSRKMAGFADWVVVNIMLAVDKLQDTIVSLFFLPRHQTQGEPFNPFGCASSVLFEWLNPIF
jgi:hypothetical protein